MTGRDPIGMLRYEATRRPEVAALLARVSTLTDAEIAQAPVPLPWYRQALTTLRDREKAAASYAAVEHSMRDLIIDGKLPDREGELFRYLGDTIWVNLGATQLQLVYDSLVFFPAQGGVWLDTIFSPTVDPRLRQGQSQGLSTRQGYRQAVRAKLSRMHPDAPQTVCTDAGAAQSQPLSHLGVRIQR